MPNLSRISILPPEDILSKNNQFSDILICHKTVISDSFGRYRWACIGRFFHYPKLKSTGKNMTNLYIISILLPEDILSKNNQLSDSLIFQKPDISDSFGWYNWACICKFFQYAELKSTWKNMPNLSRISILLPEDILSKNKQFPDILICHKTVISDSFGWYRWACIGRFFHYPELKSTWKKTCLIYLESQFCFLKTSWAKTINFLTF